MKKTNVKKLLAGLSALCVIGSALPLGGFAAESTMIGDANCDGKVDISDAVLIMQSLASPNKYGITGSDPKHITDQGKKNADCDGSNDGVTNADALAIQQYLLGLGELSGGGSGEDDDPVSDVTYIHLKGGSVEVEGEYAEVNGTTVTISHSGTFYVDGTLDDGQICVNVPDEKADPETVKIFLNGAFITGASQPAVFISNAENTSINIVDGTTNVIQDGDSAYTGEFEGCAVIEAKDDVTIKGGDIGDGVLDLAANVQIALFCNNDIKINGGKLNVTTSNKDNKNDAIKAKQSITVKSGIVNIDAEGDGIKSTKENVEISGGRVTIKAGNDAVQAGTDIDVSGGTLIAGGDRGLTADAAINITGGTVIATATDYQADTALMSGTTQGTMILNCIEDPDNSDGCWRKANSISVGSVNEDFTKKYAYVLISDASINSGSSYELTNVSSGNAVQYTGGVQFVQNELITVYNEVNPAGVAAPGGQVTPPAPTPANGEYSVTLSSSGIATDASAEVAFVNGGVLTITQPGVFTVTGEMTGGQIVVDVDKSAYPDGVVELELSGMSLTNQTAAPIYVASIGDEVVITAKNGTENTISDGTSHTDSYTDSNGEANAIDAAIFSRDDLKFKGKGTLIVNGNTADGIVSKNDIKINNGNITVNAADDGIRGKDSVTIGAASAEDYSNLVVKVETKAGDGIKSTATDTASDKSYGIVTINGGTVDIKSYADGIQAEQDFVMNGGDLTIYTYEGSSYTGSGTTAGGNTGNTGAWGGRPGMGGFGGDGNSNKPDISAKGIKAVGIYDASGTTWQSGGNIAINGGTLNIDSSDDSLHCGGDMTLKGGQLTLSSADDAAHSDHTLTIGTMGGGYDDIVIVAEKCYEGIEAQKIYQNSGSVIINSIDDGYNAAGGADGSGNTSTGPWGQGGFGGSGSGDYLLQFNGGFALVNATDGDHDGFDSNGNIEIKGGYLITNGNEPFDSDGSISVTGGVWVSNGGSGGMGGFGGGSSMTATVTSTTSVSANTRLSLVGSDGQVIVSFIVDKNVSQLKAGGPGVPSGATFVTGGTLTGSTYFQQLDQTQLAAYGGRLS